MSNNLMFLQKSVLPVVASVMLLMTACGKDVTGPQPVVIPATATSFITFQESAVNSGLVTDKDIFGVSRGNQLGINAGAYEIIAYDLAGRMIFQQKASAKAGFITMMAPRNTCNVNIVRLTQGNRSIVKKMQVER